MDNNVNQPANGQQNQNSVGNAFNQNGAGSVFNQNVNENFSQNGQGAAFNRNFNQSFSQTAAVNYGMGTVQTEKNVKNMIIGIAASLIVTILGVVLYCVLGSAANIIFFPTGAVILAGEIFLYGKINGKLDAIGIIAAIVFAFIAVFVGTRMVEIYAIKGQYGYSYSYAKTIFKLAVQYDSDSKLEYVKNIMFGYIFSIGYAALYIANRKKKRK